MVLLCLYLAIISTCHSICSPILNGKPFVWFDIQVQQQVVFIEEHLRVFHAAHMCKLRGLDGCFFHSSSTLFPHMFGTSYAMAKVSRVKSLVFKESSSCSFVCCTIVWVGEKPSVWIYNIFVFISSNNPTPNKCLNPPIIVPWQCSPSAFLCVVTSYISWHNNTSR